MDLNNRIEVLSPVGDMERLKYAIAYGADAVYLGGTTFGMRATSANFDYDTLKQAVIMAHSKGVKVYLTCNTLPTNDEVDGLEEYLINMSKTGIDAIIVADIGILMTAKRVIPDMEIHISTQTGIVNHVTATELYNMGAKRVVLARELDLENIKRIRDNDNYATKSIIDTLMNVYKRNDHALSTNLDFRTKLQSKIKEPYTEIALKRNTL